MLALFFLTQCSAVESPPEQERPKPHIQLMTSLPLVWGDDASMESILSGGSEPAPIYQYWQEQYDITAVDSLENLVPDDPDIVILAQPRAMDPADLTDLDSWVRSGGDVIILTDPILVWPSELPLGDPRRPLASGFLSPLLDHWGLELVRVEENSADIANLRFGGYSFATRGVGRLENLKSRHATDIACETSTANFLVQCSIGKGQASIVADADFLNSTFWTEKAKNSPKSSGAAQFVDGLVQDHIERASGGN